MDFEFKKNAVTPVILPFANSKIRATNLFEVLPTSSQSGKPENLQRNPFILKSRAAKDEHL